MHTNIYINIYSLYSITFNMCIQFLQDTHLLIPVVATCFTMFHSCVHPWQHAESNSSDKTLLAMHMPSMDASHQERRAFGMASIISMASKKKNWIDGFKMIR